MNYKLNKSEIVRRGLVFDLKVDEIEYESGNRSIREVAIHNGGAVVVPVTDDNRIIFVRQFRYPLQQWLLELPAGKLGKNEDPLKCALRELKEETGYRAERVKELGCVFTTPGFCTEKLYLYAAYGLKAGDHEREEGELGMQVYHLTMEEIEAKIINQEIVDAKTLSALLYFKLK